MNLLDIVYELQVLRGRHDDTDGGLDEISRARLVGLDSLLKGEYAGGRPPHDRTRLDPALPCQLTVPGGLAAGEVHSLTSRGIALTTRAAAAIPRGTRTIVRIADADARVEYAFPATVVWARGQVLGVAFDGAPSRTPFLTRGHWARAVRFAAAAEPLVA